MLYVSVPQPDQAQAHCNYLVILLSHGSLRGALPTLGRPAVILYVSVPQPDQATSTALTTPPYSCL